MFSKEITNALGTLVSKQDYSTGIERGIRSYGHLLGFQDQGLVHNTYMELVTVSNSGFWGSDAFFWLCR